MEHFVSRPTFKFIGAVADALKADPEQLERAKAAATIGRLESL